MRKRDLKYIVFLGLLFTIYVLSEILAPPQVNWNITYDEKHKIPYGTYALNTLLPDIFGNHSIKHSNSTFYDLQSSISEFDNLIIISNSFTLNEEDENVLMEMLDEGKNIFIAADWFQGDLFDTLHVQISHSIVRGLANTIKDSSFVYMSEWGEFNEKGPFKYLNNHASLYFYDYDSLKAEIFAVNQSKDPVLIKHNIGNGTLILCSLPMAFTNYYLLQDKNQYFASNALSLLPLGNVHWTNYYHYGRLEPVSKLRFILSQPSLKWAYYLALSAIVLFMIFGSKRRQRAIPVIKPPTNSTLDFIGTMGNLYFNKGNNLNIAKKKITYFLDYLRQRYYLKTDHLNEDFASKLALKTNKTIDEVNELLILIKSIEQKKRLENQDLIHLNKKIEDYYFN